MFRLQNSRNLTIWDSYIPYAKSNPQTTAKSLVCVENAHVQSMTCFGDVTVCTRPVLPTLLVDQSPLDHVDLLPTLRCWFERSQRLGVFSGTSSLPNQAANQAVLQERKHREELNFIEHSATPEINLVKENGTSTSIFFSR